MTDKRRRHSARSDGYFNLMAKRWAETHCSRDAPMVASMAKSVWYPGSRLSLSKLDPAVQLL